MPSSSRAQTKQEKSIWATCFLLCDYVQVAGGKLSILGGGWSQISPEILPTRHSFMIAVRLGMSLETARAIKAGDQSFEFGTRVSYDDGRTIGEEISAGEISWDLPEDPGATELTFTAPFAAELELTEPGRFKIELIVNDEVISHARFQVMEPVEQVAAESSSPREHQPSKPRKPRRIKAQSKEPESAD